MRPWSRFTLDVLLADGLVTPNMPRIKPGFRPTVERKRNHLLNCIHRLRRDGPCTGRIRCQTPP
jgi:hypothetical protein